MDYYPRAIDTNLAVALESVGAVVLEGPRGCGKTETGLHSAKSSIRLDQEVSRSLAVTSPSRALSGETPRLIDEWQLVPSIWNEIRYEVDSRRAAGQFILSGSATPTDDVTRHTGAGRFARLRMRPMALGESNPSPDGITLRDLIEGRDLPIAASDVDYGALAEAAVIGGWPALLGDRRKGAHRYARDYAENIVHSDMSALGTRFAPQRVRRLLRSVARNVASEATARTIANDVSADGGSISPDTVRTYLDALSRIFILEELPAWSGSLRSKSRLRTQPKLHFCDPSLACAVLQATPNSLADDPEYFGQVFESMVVRDIRTYAEQVDAFVFGYRDNTDLEVDLIIEFFDGGWAGIEVKLGESPEVIAIAERNLLKLARERMKKEPRFLAVVTGGRNIYTLPSGVHVIPLALMRPLSTQQ